jgi:hypothetical protein
MATELGAYDITIDGKPWEFKDLNTWFESTVSDLVNGTIAVRTVGQLVLSRIKHSKGEVWVYPRYKDGLNAEATFKLKDDRGHLDPNTIVVWFKPQQWAVSLSSARQAIPKDLRAFEPGMLRDEVLLHELVHAGRLLHGFAQKSEKLTEGAAAAYEDREEFAAILVTNIYMSEKGAKALRASHGGDGFPYILDEAQSSSEGYLKNKDNYELVKHFCQTDPLAPKLKDINTRFNPVRTYLSSNPQDLEINAWINPD